MAGCISTALELNISAFASALQTAQSHLAAFQRSAGQSAPVASPDMSGMFTGMAEKGKSVALSIGSAVATAIVTAAAAAAAASVGIVGLAIQRAVSDEQMRVSMEVLIGDTDQATETIENIRKLGASTPFEFPDLADAARKLIAFGEGADTVTETLRKIGDVSSGVGAPIGELSELYGKARVQGTLFAEDLNQLMGRGIPIMGEFAKQLGVSEGEVKKLASEGKVTFPMLEQAFADLTSEGGKFGGMMAKQSATVGGLWSTLQDGIGSALLALGQPITDAIRPMLTEAIEIAGSLQGVASRIGEAIGSALQYIIATFQTLSAGELMEAIAAGLSLAFKEAINVLVKGMMGIVAAFISSMIDGVRNVISVFEILLTADFWKGMGNALLALGHQFNALILEGVAAIIGELKQVPGLGKLIGDGDQQVRDLAAEFTALRDDALSKTGSNLAPAMDKIADRWVATVSGAGNAFLRGFNNANDTIDTSGDRSVLNALGDKISGAVEKARASVKDEKLTESTAVPEKTEPKDIGGSAGPLGGFAQALNVMSGRAANAGMLEELKRSRELLSEIKENTKPKAPEAKPAAAVPVKDGVFT